MPEKAKGGCGTRGYWICRDGREHISGDQKVRVGEAWHCAECTAKNHSINGAVPTPKGTKPNARDEDKVARKRRAKRKWK